MKTKKFTTSQLTILGLMAGILFLMAYTPLGYLNIGPLAVTFNVIPVAVCAIVLGPTGGAIAGAVFGLTSFMQAIGIGGVSALGSALFQINPFMTAVQCFGPRILDGICIGFIYRAVHKKANTYVSCAVTGFFSAFLNTLFFMTALIVMFGNTELIRNLMGGHNIIVGCCLMVGVNAISEMVSSTIITAAVGTALSADHISSQTGCTENSQKGCNDSWTRSEDRTEYHVGQSGRNGSGSCCRCSCGTGTVSGSAGHH